MQRRRPSLVDRRTFVAAGLTALALSHRAEAQGAAPIVLKFSHVVAPDTPKGRGALKFKELAEAYSGGRLKVEVYPNAQLYKDKEELEALQLGAVQMLAPSLAKFGPLGSKEFEVFDLPFLLTDAAAVHAVTDGPIGAKLLKGLEAKGIAGLAYWDNGFKVFTAKKALRLPADFKGLKVRIQSSKVLDAQTRALGAFPQVMSFSEVYQALDTGVVDASESDLSNVFTANMFEVQKFVTRSNHGYLGYAVVANKAFMDGLPPDVRVAVDKAMLEATAYVRQVSHELEDAAAAGIRQKGKMQIITLTPEERSAWIAALQPVYAQVEGRVGKALIEEVRAAAQASVKSN